MLKHNYLSTVKRLKLFKGVKSFSDIERKIADHSDLEKDLLSVFSRKPAFGYRVTAIAMCTVTALSTLVWGHHMYTTGMSPLLGKSFMFLTLLISIPSAMFFLNWLGTMWKGSIHFTSPMLFSIGVIWVLAWVD